MAAGTVEGGNSGSGSMSFNLTGLNPGTLYDITLYGDRNSSADGDEEFSIHGTDWHTNISSSSTIIDTFTARMETRPNSVAGHVVRWTDINPGSDGAFSIEIDPEFTDTSNLAYLTALRLMTIARKPLPEVIYHETFGNDSGADQGLSYADWTGYYGSSATLLPSTGATRGDIVRESVDDGAPRVSGPVNSDDDGDESDNTVAASGFVRLLWPAGGRGISITRLHDGA